MTRKLKNVENETQTLFDMEYGGKHLKTWKIRNAHYRTQIMAKKKKIMENEKHTVGHELWLGTLKQEKKRNAHCRIWNMARNLKNVENETQTLYDMEYGAKHLKTWKFRNAHYRTQIMAKKVKIMENEKHTLQDVKYGQEH